MVEALHRNITIVSQRMTNATAGSLPTFSLWALDTPVTLARRGSCMRPSGGRSTGGGRPIGEEIGHRRCHHMCFYNTPGLTGQKSERREDLEARL